MAPSFSTRSSRMTSIAGLLFHDVGQEPEMPGALDRLGELALPLGRHGGDPRRHDLAALRDEALEQADILVVDLGGVLAREGTGLAAAKEGAAHRLVSL